MFVDTVLLGRLRHHGDTSDGAVTDCFYARSAVGEEPAHRARSHGNHHQNDDLLRPPLLARDRCVLALSCRSLFNYYLITAGKDPMNLSFCCRLTSRWQVFRKIFFVDFAYYQRSVSRLYVSAFLRKRMLPDS